MDAIVQNSYGTADTLRLAEIDKPSIAAKEVLVQVRAAGLNRGTWHLMAGKPYLMRLAFGFRRPRNPVPGQDVAGVVVEVGAEVTRFQPGDEVFGIARGSFAQYAAAPEDKLAHKPANLEFEQAAVVPISGLTALQAVRDKGRVEAGQKVLVIGASGGVGTFAVQVAKADGAEVTGVCSTAKVDLVRSIGADHVLDYTRDDFADGSQRYDLILDIGGNGRLSRLRRALAPNGTLVIVGGEEGGNVTGGLGRSLRAALLSLFVGQRLTMLIAREHHAGLDALRPLIEAGSVTPAVDRIYGLAEAPVAMRRLEAGQVEERSPSRSRREPPDEPALSEVVASRSGSGLERVVREHAAGFIRRYTGLSVGAVVGDEQATLGFGRANEDGRAPDGRTIFQIGSVTKVFTALLLADAVLRGEVTLDQPVGALIPAVAAHPQGRPITLLDLATHSSGLPRLPPGLARQALRHRADPYAGFTTHQLVGALSRTPKRPPGAKVVYSNFGAGVLGEALCRATGTTFDELVHARISQPLGLDDTMVQATSEQHHRLATGHSRRGKPVADWQLPAMPAAGALRSSAADLVTFIRAHLHPGRSPLAEPLHLLMQPRVRAGRHLHVALGWHVLERKGKSNWLWHNGGTGGFFSFVAIDRCAQAGVAVLTNSARPLDRLGSSLLELLVPGTAPTIPR